MPTSKNTLKHPPRTILKKGGGFQNPPHYQISENPPSLESEESEVSEEEAELEVDSEPSGCRAVRSCRGCN